MTARDKESAKALGKMLVEDMAIARGQTTADMSPEWHDFAEAVGLFVYATGQLERAATTGALVYVAARLP